MLAGYPVWKSVARVAFCEVLDMAFDDGVGSFLIGALGLLVIIGCLIRLRQNQISKTP